MLSADEHHPHLIALETPKRIKAIPTCASEEALILGQALLSGCSLPLNACHVIAIWMGMRAMSCSARTVSGPHVSNRAREISNRAHCREICGCAHA